MKKISYNDFIDRASKIHNFEYGYTNVKYVNSKTKISIDCNKHGEFFQTPFKHLSGQKCPKCSKVYKPTLKEFIEQARIIHGNTYDYSQTVYVNAKTPIVIICKRHGEFKMTPDNHIRGNKINNKGNGCKKCVGKIKCTEDFINHCSKIHHQKYNYSKTTFNTLSEKVSIICPDHGLFSQIAYSHLRGKGCAICMSSKGEKIIKNFLIENEILFKPQKTFKKCINPITGHMLKFDFYLLDFNVCIEYDGHHHYIEIPHWGGKEKLQKTQHSDLIKKNYCKKNKIKLIRIKYNNSFDPAVVLSQFIKKN